LNQKSVPKPRDELMSQTVGYVGGVSAEPTPRYNICFRRRGLSFIRIANGICGAYTKLRRTADL